MTSTYITNIKVQLFTYKSARRPVQFVHLVVEDRYRDLEMWVDEGTGVLGTSRGCPGDGTDLD